MADTVFILGAGASQEAGGPLMLNFLDVAATLLRTGAIGGDSRTSFEAVLEGVGRLQQVHSKSEYDIQNIESVFAAFEIARTIGKFGDYDEGQIERLYRAMKTVIVKTIEHTVTLPVSHPSEGRGTSKVWAPTPYDRFVEFIISYFREKKKGHKVAVVTFNYDMALDCACQFYEVPITYALEDSPSPSALPLLKLHGSLNWAECKDGSVRPWYLNDYLNGRSWDLFFRQLSHVQLDIGSNISQYPHCEEEVLPEPYLVPPTWNKGSFHQPLAAVWARAAAELSSARNIFVIGYSLPDSDAFFRSLYALGTVSNVPLERFWVFNPEDSGDTEDRFFRLLGPGARQRFRYIPRSFSASIPLVDLEMKKDSF